MEGKFYRHKDSNHPHTNMAKVRAHICLYVTYTLAYSHCLTILVLSAQAALNMMTRTAAADYAEDRIYMNAVDTGWITDENPFDKVLLLRARRHTCPFPLRALSPCECVLC